MIYITYLNYLGGFNYWPFSAKNDHNLEIVDSGEMVKNTFYQWPKSYGAFADTVRRQTFRKTRKQVVIRSQPLGFDQAKDLGEQIKSSPLVQLMTSRRDRRTVLIDTDSFTVVKEMDKLHALTFTISYTDDIPSQTV
jgi:hypothetical protein